MGRDDLRDPLEHGTHVFWHAAAVGVDQRDGHRGRDERGQHRDQVACFEMGLEAVTWRLDDAKSGQTRGGVRVGAVQINKMIATALGRVGLPEDIGAAVALLLSPESRWINGQRIEVSGGVNLRPVGSRAVRPPFTRVDVRPCSRAAPLGCAASFRARSNVRA